ncbi:TlpA disulfide reductase family protein [uncultured Psychroserpens sp.]|uniref:TlpA family protein disulfide reductase n=1 Tax=uncultured Psychroserpens sp. TaxID=255436 RepID=UPI002612BFA4|nr:TlpA disulfide reductase family protein [uncultured Psychroserpens sp.]
MKKHLLLFWVLLFALTITTAQTSAPDFDDKNIVYKSEEGKVLTKDEVKTLYKTYGGDNVQMKYKMNKGKMEITLKVLDTTQKVKINKQHQLSNKEWINSKVGKEFPEFSLANLIGQKISSNTIKGKVTVFNFWFINCLPCIKEMPDLNTLVNKYQNKDVLFLAPTYETKEDLVDFFETREEGFDYDVLFNAKPLLKKLLVSSYPTHIVVSKEGIITDVLIGYDTDIVSKLSKAINTNLN